MIKLRISSMRHALPWFSDAGAAVLLAFALGWGADAAVNGQPLLWPALVLVLAGLLRAGVHVLAVDWGMAHATNVKATWRQRIWPGALVTAPGDRRMLGESAADAIDRIEDLEGQEARFRPLRLAAMVSPLLVALAAAFASPVAAAILLATLLPFAFGMALAGGAAAAAARRQLEALSRLSGLFADRVRNLPIILSFGAGDRVARQFGAAADDVAERTIVVLRIAFVSGAVIEFFAAISVALVAVYCGFALLDILPFDPPEVLTFRQAMFVLALAPEFYLPMRRLAAAYHDKDKGAAATARLEVLPVAAVTPSDALETPPALIFDRVEIQRGERRIGPFSFVVPAGQMTVVEAPSGQGKTSLLHTLAGLAQPCAGEIRVDGEARALAGQMGWAGQAVVLVPGTLADNIRLVRADATDADVQEVAALAGLEDVIAERGLDLWLDHRGSGLSGGERRRIGIARVLLRDAPLWVLDEPTADLDAAMAQRLMAMLRERGRERTLLVATHDARLATIADHRVQL